MSWQRRVLALGAAVLACGALVDATVASEELTAREIVERVLFQVAFDGERSYDQNGPVPPECARSDEASAFGFSAIRFAVRSAGWQTPQVPRSARQFRTTG